jgi:hypothetical protein
MSDSRPAGLPTRKHGLLMAGRVRKCVHRPRSEGDQHITVGAVEVRGRLLDRYKSGKQLQFRNPQSARRNLSGIPNLVILLSSSNKCPIVHYILCMRGMAMAGCTDRKTAGLK